MRDNGSQLRVCYYLIISSRGNKAQANNKQGSIYLNGRKPNITSKKGGLEKQPQVRYFFFISQVKGDMEIRDTSIERSGAELQAIAKKGHRPQHSESLNSHFDEGPQQYRNSILSNEEGQDFESNGGDLGMDLEGSQSN